MKKYGLISVILLLLVSFSSVSCSTDNAPSPSDSAPSSSSSEVIRIVWEDNGAIGSASYKLMEQMRDRIVTATQGRVDLELHPMDEIVQRNQIAQSVTEGALDMGSYSSASDFGRLGNKAWLCTPSGLPAASSGADCAAWVYNGGGLTAMRDILDPFGLFLLGVRPWPAEVFCYSNEILDDAEDFQGVKFRTQGVWAEILADYGASVVTLSGGEVYQAMERGVIDAFELGPPSYNWPLGFEEICKYIGIPGIHSPGSAELITMNKDVWNSLPSDVQQIFQDEVIAMGLYGYGQLLVADAEAMNNYQNSGIEFFTLSEDFQKDIARKSKAKMEGWASEDASFAAVWEQQNDFYRKWAQLQSTTSDFTVYTVD